MSSYAIGLEDVRRAAATIAGHVLRTPLVPAPRLSELTGATVFVKHENMHPTGAFKERGAATKLASLSAD
jgi:threonine dehydratase